MEISSPRLSANPPTPSSTRSSLSIDRPSRLTAGHAPRRNRSALRDYYKLQTATAGPDSQPVSSTASPHRSVGQDTIEPTSPSSPIEAFDAPDFDTRKYIDQLLAEADLSTVLKTSTNLAARIRGLDGERKALVYDNYSKLIAATETIRKMRGNMDPLAPMTDGLDAGVAEIVKKAEGIQERLVKDASTDTSTAKGNVSHIEHKKQVRTVRWALDAPNRMEALIKRGKKDEAEQEWETVKRLLDSWTGVKGVEELREKGDKILGID